MRVNNGSFGLDRWHDSRYSGAQVIRGHRRTSPEIFHARGARSDWGGGVPAGLWRGAIGQHWVDQQGRSFRAPGRSDGQFCVAASPAFEFAAALRPQSVRFGNGRAEAETCGADRHHAASSDGYRSVERTGVRGRAGPDCHRVPGSHVVPGGAARARGHGFQALPGRRFSG